MATHSDTPVHFVGSVPLASTEDVFRTLASSLPSERLRRIPDGETCERGYFTAWQKDTLVRAGLQHLLKSPFEDDDNASPFTQDEIQNEVDKLPDLQTQYDTVALSSYAIFAALQASSVIPQTTRFQVCLTTAVNCMLPVHPAFQAAIEPHFEDALIRASYNLQAGIPHDRLAIQIDLAFEFAWLHDVWYSFWTPESKTDYIGEPKLDRLVQRAVKMAETVADDVELGFHLCYGDARKEHFVQPRDTNMLVNFALGLIDATPRSINWLHMPVPKSRDDDAYFEPLSRLLPKLGKTELYLGLVHEHDLEGTLRRFQTAERHVPRFGISTECGLGRRGRLDLESVLRIM